MKLRALRLGLLVCGLILVFRPAAANALDIKPVPLAAGDFHTLALKPDGSLWAWGNNMMGQLGTGDRISRDKPVQVGTGFVSVAAKGYFSMALKADGSVWAWGRDGHDLYPPVPTYQCTGFVAVATGKFHRLGLRADGSLWSWGLGLNGQLGFGVWHKKELSPKYLGAGFVSVAAGELHSLAVKADGSLWVWGDNQVGQLGLGDNDGPRWEPVQAGTGFVSVAAGMLNSFGFKADGSLWTWGWYAPPVQAGINVWRNIPYQLASGFVSVATGILHGLGIKADGSLWGWGTNGKGQLGPGLSPEWNYNKTYSWPVQLGSGFVSSAGGVYHSLGLKADGSLWAWGAGSQGQLGLGGTQYNRQPPTQVPGVWGAPLVQPAGSFAVPHAGPALLPAPFPALSTESDTRSRDFGGGNHSTALVTGPAGSVRNNPSLAAALGPASPAFSGLPGPLPPAPPPLPTPPPDTGFDYVLVYPNGTDEPFQIGFGTELRNKIVMYGSGAPFNIFQYIETFFGDDWLLQVGGDQDTAQYASCGAGNDTLYQYGGLGYSFLYAEDISGSNTIIQVGGQGRNDMWCAGGDDADRIEQYGGPGDNSLEVDGYFGDDVIFMYGGPANNTFTYHVSDGNDQATIMGGAGVSNRLTIYQEDENLNFTLKDYQGRVLFRTGEGGTTITVANLHSIKAIRGIGEAQRTIYAWPTAFLPAIISLLLMD